MKEKEIEITRKKIEWSSLLPILLGLLMIFGGFMAIEEQSMFQVGLEMSNSITVFFIILSIIILLYGIWSLTKKIEVTEVIKYKELK